MVTSNSAELETGSDLGRESALRSAEHDIEEFLRRRDRWNVLEAHKLVQKLLLSPKKQAANGLPST